MCTLKIGTIACLGSGSGEKGDPYYNAMVEVGRLLARTQITVVTGGFGGIGMQAPAQGAHDAGGETIGYTIFGKPGNAYLSRVVNCDNLYINPLHQSEPPKEVQFGIRLGSLMTADGFIIAAGGGPGTMVELMTLINFNYKVWKKPNQKRIAILKLDGVKIAGWDEQMLEQLEAWGLLPPEVRGTIFITSIPEEAVSWAIN